MYKRKSRVNLINKRIEMPHAGYKVHAITQVCVCVEQRNKNCSVLGIISSQVRRPEGRVTILWLLLLLLLLLLVSPRRTGMNMQLAWNKARVLAPRRFCSNVCVFGLMDK